MACPFRCRERERERERREREREREHGFVPRQHTTITKEHGFVPRQHTTIKNKTATRQDMWTTRQPNIKMALFVDK